MVPVRLLLQSGGLSAHRRRSATAAAEDWQRHPETPLWAGHHGPGRERSPAFKMLQFEVYFAQSFNSAFALLVDRPEQRCCVVSFQSWLSFLKQLREYYVPNVYMLLILQMIVPFVCFQPPFWRLRWRILTSVKSLAVDPGLWALVTPAFPPQCTSLCCKQCQDTEITTKNEIFRWQLHIMFLDLDYFWHFWTWWIIVYRNVNLA